jgi:hypothetical protein
MYSNGALGIFTDIKEGRHDVVWWHAAVHKEQVVVLKASISEPPRVIDLLVQPNNCRDVVLPKIREVCFRSMQWITCLAPVKSTLLMSPARTLN